MKFDGIQKYTSVNISRNLEIAEIDEKYIPRGSSIKYYPMTPVKAKGSHLWDRDGNKYIDFLTSAAVYNIGHSHPAVLKAVKEQTDEIMNYITGYFYQEKQAFLAKKLCEITPGDFEKKVAFGSSGSDANSSAIKAARAYTGRKNIIAFMGSYHGTSYGPLGLTGMIGEEMKQCVCPLPYSSLIEFPDPSNNIWGINGYEFPEKLKLKALEECRKKIRELDGDVAAIIIEPFPGDRGAIIPPKGFMEELKQLCENEDILFIAEEIQSGMGRTGKFWSIEHFDVEPDILVAGKALGGGMPISAVIGRDEIMESVPPPLYAFTHIGHSVMSSAALAAIKVTFDERLPEKALAMGDYLAEKFEALAAEFPILGDIRHKGLLFGVEVSTPGNISCPDRDTALKICWRAWEMGLILITFGMNGNVLRIAPPLNIDRETADQAMDIIRKSVKDTMEGKVPDNVVGYFHGW